ncbi:MAG: triose-phosphate isomerase [Clostridia bacterium]|nr:triose-phosphate isomerase [Clostridia bacterium]
MNQAKRRTVIAGNWKMNMTPSQTTALINEMKTTLPAEPACDVVLCVPFVDIAAAKAAAEGSVIKVGAENVHFEAKGAFTGEISAEMLTECGVEYVIVGHSERRQYFGETDDTVNKRLLAGVNAGLTVILCVGELLDEREKEITAEVVSIQTKVALRNVDAEMLKKVIIAYEPVWAIGTGLTATSEQAEEVCAIIRKVLADKYGNDAAQGVTIQYGGSMNAGNAAELLSKENVDGGLIGGASLKAADFAKIVEASNQ